MLLVGSEDYWDGRNKDDVANSHTDWLCKYDLLDPLLKPMLKRPRLTALVIGSGTSNFPEQLYDRGAKEVVVIDRSWRAMEAVKGRNVGSGRTGLTCITADIADKDPPKLPDPAMAFDLVIDKGTLDLLLVTEDGWERAHCALKWMYSLMKTPASMVYVSHSPPHDRMPMLTSVYWHDAVFKMVQATSVAQLVAHNPYSERIVDYPYAVAGFEQQQAKRREEAARAGIMGPPAVAAAAAAAMAADERGLEPHMPPPRPAEDLGFAAATAYVYVLEK